MADDYIDYSEVSEYGVYFVDQAKQLVGASPLVDIDALRSLVEAGVADVDAELEKVGVKRSDLRGNRGDVGLATGVMRREIERFHNYLGSLDDDAPVDRGAFFAGEKLGTLAALKPADVKARADEILRGFSAPANEALPERVKWEGKLRGARDTFAAALSGKGSARSVSIQGTAGLIAARERFLRTYNGVAKRLIQGLLSQLQREHDMRLFFLDLQVNERPAAKKPEAEKAGNGAPAAAPGEPQEP